MAKRRRRIRRQAARMLTAERLRRIYRLLKSLATRPRTRPQLLWMLRVDQRTFYRDLEILRQFGIRVVQQTGVYVLETPMQRILALLPMPDPRLTLAEAQVLAQGRSQAHRKLSRILRSILGSYR